MQHQFMVGKRVGPQVAKEGDPSMEASNRVHNFIYCAAFIFNKVWCWCVYFSNKTKFLVRARITQILIWYSECLKTEGSLYTKACIEIWNQLQLIFDALKHALKNHHCFRAAAVLINANGELSRGLPAVSFHPIHGLKGVVPTFLSLGG